MKTNIINGSLTVGEKLMDIHKNKEESCLYPVLRSLFSTMGYRDVEVTHGNNEFGRDLIFRDDKDPFNPEIWYAVVVKKIKMQNRIILLLEEKLSSKLICALKCHIQCTMGNLCLPSE